MCSGFFFTSLDFYVRITSEKLFNKKQTMKKQSSKNLLKSIKKLTGFNNEIVAGWLGINPKTFNPYKEKGIKKEEVEERAIKLFALLKHGEGLFSLKFDEWLDTENFFFDGKKPLNFLSTIKGIEFIESRLVAMEDGGTA